MSKGQMGAITTTAISQNDKRAIIHLHGAIWENHLINLTTN